VSVSTGAAPLPTGPDPDGGVVADEQAASEARMAAAASDAPIARHRGARPLPAAWRTCALIATSLRRQGAATTIRSGCQAQFGTVRSSGPSTVVTADRRAS